MTESDGGERDAGEQEKTLREVIDEYEDQRSELSLRIRKIAARNADLPDH
jgi:hypothetical protein